MRKILSLAMALVLFISLLPFHTDATQNYPEWESWEETHEIPYKENQSIVYTYVANDFESITNTVAFEYPRQMGNLMVWSDMDDAEKYPSPPVVRLFNNETVVYVVTFTQGYAYRLFFENYSKDKQPYTVKTYPWDDSMWPTITVGEPKSVDVQKGLEIDYIFTAPTSGLYTLTTSCAALGSNISVYPDMNIGSHPKAYPPAIFLDYTREPNGMITHYFFLEAGGRYTLTAYGEAEGASGTITLTEGAPSDRFGLLQEGKPQTLTIEPHDNDNPSFKTLVFQAPRSGRYCLYSDNFFSFDLRNDYGQPPSGGGISFSDGSNRSGWVYELEEGAYYTITVGNYTSKKATDTIQIVPVDTYKNAELQIIRYYRGSSIAVGFVSDPPCAEVDGITWSVSDPSVFTISGEFGSFVELNVLKAGTAELSATVGGVTAKLTINTDEPPHVMEEGKTTVLYHQGGVDAAGTFAPAVSGTYKLHLKPRDSYIRLGERTMMLRIQPESYPELYRNHDLTGEPAIELELEAGKVYNIYLDTTVDAWMELVAATPAPTEPAPTEPVATEPVATEPVVTEPAVTEPVVTEPVVTEPVVTEPVVTEPVATEPVVTEPVVTEPVVTEPVVTEPVATEPVATEPEGTTPGEQIIVEENSALLKDTLLDEIQPDQPLKIDLTPYEKLDTVQFSSNLLYGCSGLSLQLPQVSFGFSQDTLQYLAGQAGVEQLTLRAQISDPDSLNAAQLQTLQGMNIHAVLNVDLSFAGMTIHELGYGANITLPVPADHSGHWQVWYVSETGESERLAPISGNKEGQTHITVYTDHFSTFVLVEIADADNHSAGWILPAAIGLVAVAGIVTLILVLKKKKATA